MTEFEQLQAELDALTELRKAHAEPDGDEDENGNEDDTPKDEEEEEEGGEEGTLKKGKGKMCKSFDMTLDNGETVEAVDGMELIKSLSDRMDDQDGKVYTVLSAQTALLKAMQEDIFNMRQQGRGRKTSLTMHDKPTPTPLAKAEGIPAAEFLNKCLDAQKAGRITGLDVATAESYIQRSMDVPDSIKSRVLSTI